MIAVVTGGSGFIGRNLVDRLLRDGHTVRCLVRRTGGHAPPGAEAHAIDYADEGSLRRSAALDGADVVFHLAGATRALSAAQFTAANVTPTRKLLAALAARGLRPRFVYASSQAAAGPAAARDRPVSEQDEPRPVEEYGRSKLAAERVVGSFGHQVPATIVRPCAVYGPRDRDFLQLFRLAARGVLVYPGVREQWLSVLHVDDVVEGLVRAGTSDAASGRTLFLSPAQPVQWKDVGRHIAAAVGRDVREVDLPRWLVTAAAVAGEVGGRMLGSASLANLNKAALGRDPYWVCSGALAADLLAFHPRVTLPEGIRETYLWYVAQGWL